MSQEIIIAIIGVIGLIIGAVAGVPRIVRDIRWGIMRDLEIYKALPDASESKSALLQKIDREITSLDVHDQKRRQPFGIGLGVGFILIGAALLWLVIIYGGWWWLTSPVVLFILILGIAGFATSVTKTLRDEKGNTVKSPKTE